MAKSKIRACIIVILIALVICQQSANATDPDLAKSSLRMGFSYDQCNELIKDCISKTRMIDRNSCFNDAATNMFCQGGQLGEVAFKRYSITAGNSQDSISGNELPSPTLLDQSCIEAFDNQFSALLINKSRDKQALADLANTLDGCARTPAQEIIRP